MNAAATATEIDVKARLQIEEAKLEAGEKCCALFESSSLVMRFGRYKHQLCRNSLFTCRALIRADTHQSDLN